MHHAGNLNVHSPGERAVDLGRNVVTLWRLTGHFQLLDRLHLRHTRGVGDAEASRARGLAEAEVIRARGLAEAEVIRAKGEAEADAMKVKAAAFHEYNQAAVLDKLLTGMPEIVRAIAEPLSKVDKVTIVSTGGSDGTHGLGASRLTGDIVNMVAQVPALFELLSGTRISDLMSRVPALAGQDGDNTNSANARANGTGSTVDAASNEK